MHSPGRSFRRQSELELGTPPIGTQQPAKRRSSGAGLSALPGVLRDGEGSYFVRGRQDQDPDDEENKPNASEGEDHPERSEDRLPSFKPLLLEVRVWQY